MRYCECFLSSFCFILLSLPPAHFTAKICAGARDDIFATHWSLVGYIHEIEREVLPSYDQAKLGANASVLHN